MAPGDHDRIETLLAEALAAHDQGGETALSAFVEAQPADRAALERGLLRCRQMGLLGATPSPRDFPERLSPPDEALHGPLQGRPAFETLRTRVAARVVTASRRG